MKYLILFITLLNTCYAGNYSLNKKVVSAIYKAAKKYNVDAQDLIKIAYVESRFKTNAIRNNKNGTIDIGMFQINSVHWTTTCKNINIMILEGNALCAAKIISQIKKHADTDINWIGRYHSKTPSRKEQYVKLLDMVNIE